MSDSPRTREEMQKAFLESGGQKQKREPKPRKPMKRTRIKQTSDAKALDNARWAGIKDAFLFLGQRCAMKGEGMCVGPLDLDHIIERSKGGQSVARNARILCRKHHTERHRNEPEWSPKT